MSQGEKSKEKKQFMISILLVLIALVSISAATVAWFTIADYTKVYSMGIQITMGTNLRLDLDAHNTFDEYVKTLQFSKIADRIQKDLGYDMRETSLMPVTTSDGATFTYEDGTPVPKDSGAYLEFTLHFIAGEDMYIHLTSESSNGADGTSVTSKNAKLPGAMRISFTMGNKVYIYDPGMGDNSRTQKNIKQFGIPEERQMVPNDNNLLFTLKKEVDCPVVVRVWLEGTDADCTDELRNADYNLRLRFVGTDEDHNILTGDSH